MTQASTTKQPKTSRTQSERREEAEKRVLAAAIRLVVDKGYDGFTLADVGTKAGYSRGLAAHYFGKKDDLLAAVARYIVDRYRDWPVGAPAMPPGFDRLSREIRRYVDTYPSRPTQALQVLIPQARFHPPLTCAITSLNRNALGIWESEVQAGIETGAYRSDVDPKGVASSIHSFLRGQATFVGFDPDYDFTLATEAFIEMLRDWLLPEVNRAKSHLENASAG
jgi:AcrR family transcriptional regulator